MNYYLFCKDGTVKEFTNVSNVDVQDEKLLISTDQKSEELLLQDVILHGDENYWVQILELFKAIDRLTDKMVQRRLQKAASLGFLVGLFQ
ncbi:MAG: hypothetical protein KAX49_09230 [Halanaerobiales bacterium]|nr:hypothetical protein [Halanaerobiales bacterium]